MAERYVRWSWSVCSTKYLYVVWQQMDERLAARKFTLHSVTVYLRFYLHWMGDDMRCYFLTSYTLRKHFLSLLKLNDSNHRRPYSARGAGNTKFPTSQRISLFVVFCVWPVVLENASALKTPRLKTSICLYTAKHCFSFSPILLLLLLFPLFDPGLVG